MLKIGAKQDSSLKKACADADKNLAKLNKSAKAVGKVAIAATGAAATAVATAGVAAVKSGIDYQKHLANVSTLLLSRNAVFGDGHADRNRSGNFSENGGNRTGHPESFQSDRR